MLPRDFPYHHQSGVWNRRPFSLEGLHTLKMYQGINRGRTGDRIWVVFHCEVALSLQGPLVDEMVFFTASSKFTAMRLIRESHVNPGTWWRLNCARLDNIDGTCEPSVLYSRAGRVIRTRPFEKGFRAALRQNKQDVERIKKQLNSPQKAELSAKAIANLRDTLRSIRRVISACQ